MTKREPLLALLVLCLPLSAQAARPFVTDDARVVDPGGCQIESFVKRQRKLDEQEFWFLPACNPGWAELTLGGTWVNGTAPGDSRVTVMQAKTLLKPLETNGTGYALTLGVGQVSPFQARRTLNPYLNAIGSFSFADDFVVVHANVGANHDRQFGTILYQAEKIVNAGDVGGCGSFWKFCCCAITQPNYPDERSLPHYPASKDNLYPVRSKAAAKNPSV